MKKTIYKFLIVFSCLLVIILSLFSVSAATIVQGEGAVVNDSLKVDGVGWTIIRNNTDYAGAELYIAEQNNGLTLFFYFVDPGYGFRPGDIVQIYLPMKVTRNILQDKTVNVKATAQFHIDASCCSFIKDFGSGTRRDSLLEVNQRADTTFATSGGREFMNFNWGNSIDFSYDEYVFLIRYEITDYSTSANHVYLTNVNFDIESGTDYLADKIIDNENKNHNELIHGGTDYGDVDGSAVQGYGSAEAELNNVTAQAQSDSVSFINNFGNIFGSSHIHKGLLSVSAIFKEFFAINWMSDVLSFGLGLGCFAFILGSSYLVISRVSSNERYKEARERRHNNKGGGG